MTAKEKPQNPQGLSSVKYIHLLFPIKVRTWTAIDPTVRHCHYYLRSFRASDASDAAAATVSAW